MPFPRFAHFFRTFPRRPWIVSAAYVMIKRIRIQNFRSLVDVTVDLDSLTVLIGRSGTGKSNFVDAIRFLRNSLDARLMNVNALGGPHRAVKTSQHVVSPRRPTG
jgi:recombinational DNA repair ATPase RecF